jgi:hypothetical protein
MSRSHVSAQARRSILRRYSRRLHHNHKLERPRALDISVRDLLILGIGTIQIKRFIEKRAGHIVSRHDVEPFRILALAQALLSQTEDLTTQVSPGTQVYIYPVDLQGTQHRAGILLIEEWERENLKRFGNVI